jgi:pyruvate formate lyase activating enzyme
MNIGGLLKNSMIDFPGKLSCGIFLSGCNFDCPYCHNPDLVKGCAGRSAEFEPGNVYRFIENRKRFLDGVVISGGEPDLKTDPRWYATYIKANCNASAILSSIDIIMDSAIAYEFRTTCVKPIVTPTIIEKISRLIKGASLYALQRFHNSRMLHPDFFKEINYEYADDELMQLKAVADSWVKECIVR